jgi:UDP-N-acetylmuramate--alanine ligase
MRFKNSKFHFVGVGGIGMCGLAELLYRMGAQVTGSDASESANTLRLKKLGVQVHIGHEAKHVGLADVLVYSSAISAQNPEILFARANGIPMIPRAEALAEMMRLKRGIAIAGTHGKTTTTSLVSSIFIEAGSDPTIAVGGRLENIGSTAVLGQGEWFIAEADESDGSFHKLLPEISVITNIDSDHLDHYRTFENLKQAFLDFALKTPFYGQVIVCGDDPMIREIFQNYPKKMISYGFSNHNDYQLKGEKGVYEVLFSDTKKSLGKFEISMPGQHNALNALAAIIVALSAGLSFEKCVTGLKKFKGVDRRFQLKGTKNNIQVFDDYGHHPTEVKATLSAFREKFPDQNVIVLFQPHRYSRTQSCWHEFTQCFSQCNQILITDIYAAGELPIEGINSKRLVEEIKHSNKEYLVKDEQLVSKVKSRLKSGDIFVTLGAGDGWKVGQSILELL